ncbi:Kua-ubiquitin conjugating enzyme hybridlocalisation domain [Striga asiatica]|uniref:Kua-ubiquitin conjugating enzyme hybridlocalisation domain n=1 Tax=Striga asiatica TaxID=4170 RepID=A0A5A7RHB3_STRAF|nr:Kua-ubiquitin conjugating enzyme hybridlocalisation domain [Striga asiatica]
MAKQQNSPTIRDKSYYKATWAHRAWFAAGCASVFTTLAKSVLITFSEITKTPFAPFVRLLAAAAAGYAVADLVSGVYHWAVDNYGSARTPIFGSQIESFRAHHIHPSEITRCEAAGIAYTLAAGAAASLATVNLLFSGDPAALAFAGALAGCVMLSTVFHAWAHLPRGRLPAAAAALQDGGVLIKMSEHMPHHRPPYNGTYCTVSGMWNGVLDEYRVFGRLEKVVYGLTGVKPRSWSEPVAGWTPRTQVDNENEI